MRASDLTRLGVLAAIWGGSFMLLRITAPPFGAIATAEVRVLLAGVIFMGWLRLAGIDLAWRARWRSYLVLGIFQAAAPFSLWAYGALYLPASYLVVLNATSPLFGALLAALVLGESLTRRVALGLACGVAGVAMLVGLGPLQYSAAIGWAVAASAMAACCYAIASTYLKRRAASIDPAAAAVGSQLCASLVLAPLLVVLPPAAWPTATEWGAVATLGVVCTGIAFLLYFQLIANVGPTRALTVTFLQPAFGMLWGALFLGESITLTMVAGCGLVLAGTALILQEHRDPSGRRRTLDTRAAQ